MTEQATDRETATSEVPPDAQREFDEFDETLGRAQQVFDADGELIEGWAEATIGLVRPDLPALPPGMHTSMEVRTQTVTTTVFEARVTLRHRDGRKVQACGTADTARAAQAAAIDAGLQQLGEGDADG